MAELLSSEDLRLRGSDICPRCETVLTQSEDGLKLLTHECTHPSLQGYDWESAFSFASGSAQGGCSWSRIPDFVGDTSRTPFNRCDVVDIISLVEGEQDGAEWLLVGKLRDGRFFFLAAGCDYTGWDCQSFGRAYCANRLEDLDIFITIEERMRLALETDSHPGTEGST